METRSFTRDAWLPLLAVLLLAFNLRPVAISVGPALTAISRDLDMSGTAAGILTSLPALAFAVFGALAPELSRRIGPHRTVGIALVVLIVGQASRALVTSPGAFLLLSTVALAGMALANVLLPTLVRLHFPHRVGLATSLYSLTMTIGVTVASAGTIPLANSLGGWRGAFLAGTGIAVAALIVWLPMLRYAVGIHGRPTNDGAVTLQQVARTRMGWYMAVFFGVQSAQAYTIFGWLPTIFQDAGLDEVTAGLMLGIATGAGIIPAFIVPTYAARVREPVGLFLTIMAFLASGYLGLLLAPTSVPWLWAICLALGTASFPLILALLGLRARTSSGTAALSGFAQSVGYLIAAAGPVAVGVMYSRLGDWTVPLLTQLGLVVPMVWVGIQCTRQWTLEDGIPRP